MGESVHVGEVWTALTGGFVTRGRSVLKGALDALLPPRCLACGAPVGDMGALCGPCWQGLHFLVPPFCARCGLPLDGVGEGDMLCGACLAAPPAYARARAALGYDEQSRRLVSRFKYHDRTELAPSFATWMGRAGAPLLAECDLIAPVPLHPLRLLMRRFNQAALLALRLGRACGKQAIPDLLRRVRYTRPQVGLSPEGRRRNVAHVFRVRPRYAPRVKGARIVLVDDVLTTGATAEACARVLLRAGASAVDVLTLARVLSPRPVS